MVCSTSFILVLKIGFILTLFYSAIKSIRSLSEGPLQQLEYLGQKWSLEKKDGQSYVFKNLNIILEAGIFFLMSFSNPGEDNDNEVWHKKIVCLVFFDQLSREEYRKLCIISRAC